MARRNAIRANGFNVALSESLLVLVNNYVKATRFVFWLRENVKTRMGKAR